MHSDEVKINLISKHQSVDSVSPDTVFGEEVFGVGVFPDLSGRNVPTLTCVGNNAVFSHKILSGLEDEFTSQL